ncbi:DNA methyltransferase [Methylocystis rosea]|uniref:DNA methyltransferase n=1 Tax=Methylocystis rosea TaxID=173366 RepID=UPI0003A23CC3|nr:DNA methyltransferase [Methylocystis rosea]
MTPFQAWTGNRTVKTLGTNAGTPELSFQSWKRFKEAFAPEVIERAVRETPGKVEYCLDPFAGSGTTGLACQFLGIDPFLYEINPYLCDLIKAKLSSYKNSVLKSSLDKVLDEKTKLSAAEVRAYFKYAPKTFLPNSEVDSYVFPMDVAKELVSLNLSINNLRPGLRAFFRAILGSVCVDVSNVTISGKGRRYRRNWRERQLDASEVGEIYQAAVLTAISDVDHLGDLKHGRFKLFRGSCVTSMTTLPYIDLCVFSPPYPNSFDYTDVYNVELWTLGYLRSKHQSDRLRRSTFPSHVQLKRTYEPAPNGSRLLAEALMSLQEKRDILWHRDIPAMVGSYFAQMDSLLREVARHLRKRGRVYMIVGNSQYSGVIIETGKIIYELSRNLPLDLQYVESCRSMRTSPQQGGNPSLAENLLVFSK